MRALTGNWVGAAAVALVSMVSAYVLALVYAGIELDDSWSIGGMIKTAANLTFSTFGVPLDFSFSGGHASVTSAPLLITLVSVSLGLATFGLVTRRYPDKLDAVWDAFRTALVFGIFFTVTAVVVHIVNPWVATMSDVEGPTVGAPLNGFNGIHAAPSLAGAIFIPMIGSAVLLTVAVLRSRIPSAHLLLHKASEISLPALRGLRVLIWGTLPAGLVQLLSMQTTPGSSHSVATITEQVFTLPNYGVQTLAAGVGAPIGTRGTDFKDQVGRLGTMADHANWVVWLSIPVALLVIGLAVYLAVSSAIPSLALWSTATYLVSLLVVLPLLGVLANISIRGESGQEVTRWRVGVDITEMTFTIWGISALLCLVALLVSGRLTVAHLQARPIS